MSFNNISPSNLDRRDRCPGSARMEDGLPSVESEDASRGTILHKFMQDWIETGCKPAAELVLADLRAVEWCMDRVQETLNRFDPEKHQIHTEHTIDLDFIGIPAMEGRIRVDFTMIEAGKMAFMDDFKFGGKSVNPPKWNVQFAAYACGLRKMYNLEMVHARKLQPMAQEQDSEYYSYTAADLDNWESRIGSIVDQANSLDAPIIPGDHCGFCLAKTGCPARTRIVESMPRHRTVAELLTVSTPEQRTQFWEDLQIAIAWGKDAEKAVKKYVLEDGGILPGYEIGTGRPTRVWSDPASAVQALRGLIESKGLPPEEVYETKLISPSKAEELLGKAKAVKAIIEPLIVKEPGNPTIVKSKEAK